MRIRDLDEMLFPGGQQTPLNALILRDAKVPKGSGDGERGQPNRMVKVQRA